MEEIKESRLKENPNFSTNIHKLNYFAAKTSLLNIQVDSSIHFLTFRNLKKIFLDKELVGKSKSQETRTSILLFSGF